MSDATPLLKNAMKAVATHAMKVVDNAPAFMATMALPLLASIGSPALQPIADNSASVIRAATDPTQRMSGPQLAAHNIAKSAIAQHSKPKGPSLG